MIFQIFYDDRQLAGLDPTFVPFDNRGRRDPCYEFDVFERLWSRADVRQAHLWGAVSWRFGEKTGLTGKNLLEQISSKPGHDLYFVNPRPLDDSVYHNGWRQGAVAHPRFLEVAARFLEAAGLPVNSLDEISSRSRFSAANYFVGTPVFWSAYLPFVRAALDTALPRLGPAMRELTLSSYADPTGIHGGASYLPFLIERMLPVFLDTAGRNMGVCRLEAAPASMADDVHLMMLRDMKQAAITARSAWLAACWSNYRALYLAHRHGRAWAATHLRLITPEAISFPA